MLSLNPITYELTHRCEQELRMQEIKRQHLRSAHSQEQRAGGESFGVHAAVVQFREWLAGLYGMTPGYRG